MNFIPKTAAQAELADYIETLLGWVEFSNKKSED